MIVIDSSALIAVAQNEPETERILQLLEDTEQLFISAATVTETLIVASRRRCAKPIAAIFDQFDLVIEPLTKSRAFAAAHAYNRWGKVFNKASLNYGDSFAYALAIELDCPLLFVGNDFAQTDVKVA